VEEPEKIRFGFWTSKYDDKNMTGRFEHDVPCSCGRSTAWKYKLNVYPAKGGQAIYDTVVTPTEVGEVGKGKRSALNVSSPKATTAPATRVGFGGGFDRGCAECQEAVALGCAVCKFHGGYHN